jgi:threonine dehydratase
VSARIPTLDDIRRAARQIEGVVLRTPFLPAPRLSKFTGAEIFVKYENLQATSSFKERGALVKLQSLGEDERKRGVIAMSAGNHAQAVAYHAQRLRIPATIVMPKPTPFVKIAATRSFGAEVVLEGETLADAQVTVEAIISRTGAVLVHPYDDPEIIRGQGTIGLEIVEDRSDLDMVVVPVGGGGLISGIALAVKALKPAIEIIGVETQLYPSVFHALRGEVAKCGGDSLAEGIAVKNVGKLPLEIIRKTVSDMLLVSEGAIEEAVAAYLTLQKTMAEGAGAAPLAAVISNRETFRGKRVGLVLAGGNIDPRRLDHGARARSRGSHRRLPPDHQRSSGRACRRRGADRQYRRQHPRGAPPPHHPKDPAEGRQSRRDDRDPRSRACRRDHGRPQQPRLFLRAPRSAGTRQLSQPL